jgi:replicative DNA helicase
MNKTAKENFIENISKVVELEALKEDTAAKKAILENRRTNNALNKMIEDDKELKIIQESNFGGMSQEDIGKMQKENEEYFAAAKHKRRFIDKVFDDIVPFFKKNLILICGRSGRGKTTTAINIALETIKQISPVTGKQCRVLILTNEEGREAYYNRITCLIKGWHYVNHGDFTSEQRKTFSEMIPKLAEHIVVIDDEHGGSRGTTTTLEGIETAFDSLIDNNIHYDVIILDYYQNVARSKTDPSLLKWQVQENLSKKLDSYKNKLSAPIVVMCQLRQISEKNKKSDVFDIDRIIGSKEIYMHTTFAMEMDAEFETLSTIWSPHKSRYTPESVGRKLKTGYKDGRFVEYNDAFIAWAQKIAIAKATKEANKLIAKETKEAKEKLNGNGNDSKAD